MTSQPNELEAKRDIAALLETYRQGFLHLNAEQLASIWDSHHAPLIYVAQEKEAPIQGWASIRRYFAPLPEHLDEILAKHLEDVQIDLLGESAIAFFTSRSSVRLKAHLAKYEPSARVSFVFQRTSAGWRAIHYHESALSAQAAAQIARAKP